jgi:hypothetical protein
MFTFEMPGRRPQWFMGNPPKFGGFASHVPNDQQAGFKAY